MRRLVFFTTDSGYLIPTLVAATQVEMQAREQSHCDVAVFLINISTCLLNELRNAFPGLIFQELARDAFALPPSAHFNKTHVPQSALARLVVADRVSNCYTDPIYMDGDIQIVDDIHPLLNLAVPEGFIAAAPDVAEMVWPERGGFARGFRRYLKGLGISRGEDYFNSGVIVASRETWIEIGRSALAFIAAESEKCRFHDQSALNSVALSKRLALSSRFNFIGPYLELGVPSAGPPAVIHFSGGEKPWSDNPARHLDVFRRVYVDMVVTHAFLEPLWRETSGRASGSTGFRSTKRWRTILRNYRSASRRRRLRRMFARRRFLLQSSSDALVEQRFGGM